MINLSKLKKKQKDENAEKKKKQTAGELRVLKDMSELNDNYNPVTISFPNGADDVMNFEVLIAPDEGYYKGGEFLFSFKISPIYPHEPPNIKCKTKIIHPNIDLEGNICLNILRQDWSPVHNINTIVCGLYHLFINPNFEDALNGAAKTVLMQREANGYVGRRLWEP